MTSSNTYVIKPATEADIPDMLAMIKELAIYEKEPDAVVNTPEMMKENLFVKKYAEAFVARTPSGEAVGLALYFFTYSTWLGVPGLYLEDLYVVPEHRGGGLGKTLFGYLGEVAKERGCQRVEWRWNTPSKDFYEKRLGSEPQSEWEGERLEGPEAIERLIALKN
ncbi:Peroxygenase 1 [Vanrija albida]|uniref:Peroxygenase 1 n=1 Tax=Vanrija albida TaxID=181172 RepID=A0ABR3PUZ2_9TREE